MVVSPLLDLLGHPLDFPEPKKHKSQSKKRVKRLDEQSLWLPFDELMEALKAPLLPPGVVPQEFRSDRASVAITPDLNGDDEGVTPDIPYFPHGIVSIKTHHRAKNSSCELDWSEEGLWDARVHLFWESFEELTLNNNEGEKLSVLKWIFQPAIRRFYHYQKPTRCVHENDLPFSFHNCCLAVGIRDEEAVRDGVRRNVHPDILETVERIL